MPLVNVAKVHVIPQTWWYYCVRDIIAFASSTDDDDDVAALSQLVPFRYYRTLTE